MGSEADYQDSPPNTSTYGVTLRKIVHFSVTQFPLLKLEKTKIIVKTK